MPNSKTAIIFGETHLAISCIEHLLEKCWVIHGVVTRDVNVINWCKKSFIQSLTIEQISQIKLLSWHVYE